MSDWSAPEEMARMKNSSGSKRVDEIDVVYASGGKALGEVFQLVGVDGRLSLNDAGMDF